jgi:hypothetical protein
MPIVALLTVVRMPDLLRPCGGILGTNRLSVAIWMPVGSVGCSGAKWLRPKIHLMLKAMKRCWSSTCRAPARRFRTCLTNDRQKSANAAKKPARNGSDFWALQSRVDDCDVSTPHLGRRRRYSPRRLCNQTKRYPLLPRTGCLPNAQPVRFFSLFQ